MPNEVLIVDTDTSIWQALEAFLKEKEYAVGYSTSISEAWEKIQDTSPELVIIDLDAVVPDGMSFIYELHQSSPETKLLAVSNNTDAEFERQALAQGARFFLRKPLLKESLEQVLGLAPGSEVHNQDPGMLPRSVEDTLLRGFSNEERHDFYLIGSLRHYEIGDVIQTNDGGGAMVWVEKGRLLVYHNDVPVESVTEGECWGEEAFVNPGSAITHLVAQGYVQLRHFSRKRIIEFFAYHDETLTKRYMINLINCLQQKWNKTITRLVMALLSGSARAAGEKNAIKL